MFFFLFFCFFFFFKQKTAYEMLRSLVGSEMCIRRERGPRSRATAAPRPLSASAGAGATEPGALAVRALPQLAHRARPGQGAARLGPQPWRAALPAAAQLRCAPPAAGRVPVRSRPTPLRRHPHHDLVLSLIHI